MSKFFLRTSSLLLFLCSLQPCAVSAEEGAFDGMEVQVADYRYNTSAKDSELTGGIYRAVAPTKQIYRPTQWNTFRIDPGGAHQGIAIWKQPAQRLRTMVGTWTKLGTWLSM